VPSEVSLLLKKIALIIRILVIYVVLSFLIAFLGTLLSIGYLKKQRFTAASYYASAARGGLFSLQVFCAFQCPTDVSVWNEGLRLIQQSKQIELHSKELKAKYEFGKVTQQDLAALKADLSVAQLTLDQMMELTEQSKVIKKIAFNSQSTLKDQYSTLQFTFQHLFITIDHYDELFGGEKIYLVLFQNNYELRPTGGFLGSYATVKFKDGVMTSFEVQDIYVPDGQLAGHVDPPLPIQQAFQQGFWNLRDANWHPDFPRSAENVEWFFDQSTGEKFDGVIAVNYTLIPEMMKIVGEMYLPDQDIKINDQNVYSFLQRTDDIFFPGSTKKKDTLSSFSKYLQLKLQHLRPSQYLELASFTQQALDDKDVLLFLKKNSLQGYIDQKNWSGRFKNNECEHAYCFPDYFAISDSNMGVNKANCCVQRRVSVEKNVLENQVVSITKVSYYNPSPTGDFVKTGGTYKAFVRMYFPQNTIVEEFTIDGVSYAQYAEEQRSQRHFSEITPIFFTQDQVGPFTELGFWIYTDVGKTLPVTISTTTPLPQDSKSYQLTVQKQPGTLEMYNDFTIWLGSQELWRDTIYSDLLLVTPKLSL